MDIAPIYFSTAPMTPAQFPLLRSAHKHHERFDAALFQIAEGLRIGAIRNVVLADAKHTLSHYAYSAWDVHVRERFFDAGKWESLSKDVRHLGNSIHILGLHDVIATAKKVAKSKASGPAVEAMRSFCAEVLPLSLAVASLKDKAVKGRAPNQGPSKPVNPNKVVQTCPVCFRHIAATAGTMAHHGYRRPGGGWQTASCPGVRFKPLEVSPEGLQWLVTTLSEQLRTARLAYEQRETLPEVFLVRDHSASQRTAMKKIGRGDAEWPAEFRRHVAELESEIAVLQAELPMLEQRLATWAPAEGSLRGLAKV